MATLLEMRTQAVREADAEGYLNLADATDKAYIDSFLNAHLATLHDLLTSRFEDYQITGVTGQQVTVATTAGAQLNVPATAYKVRDVEYTGPGGTDEPISLGTFAWTERNRMVSMPRRYCVAGNLVLIRPITHAIGYYTIWHTPRFVKLTADPDTYDAINGWELLPILQSARAIKSGNGQDTSDLRDRIVALEAAIADAASKRVTGRPSRVRRHKLSYAERLILSELDPTRYGT